MARLGLFERAFNGKRAKLAADIDASSAQFLHELDDRGVLTKEHLRDIKSRPTNDERNTRLMEILDRRPDEKFPDFCEALIASGQDTIVETHFKDFYKRPEVIPATVQGVRLRLQDSLGNGDTIPDRNDSKSSFRKNNQQYGGYRWKQIALICVISFGLYYVGKIAINNSFAPPTDSTTVTVSNKPPVRVIVAKSFLELFQGIRDVLVRQIDPSHGLWDKLKDKKVLTDRQIEDCKSHKTDFDRISRMLDLLVKRDPNLILEFCTALIENEQSYIVQQYFSGNCEA